MTSANDISKLNQKLKLIESAQQVNEFVPAIPAAIAGGRALAPFAGRALQALRPAARPGPTTKHMGKAVEVPKTSLPAPTSMKAGTPPIKPPSNNTAKSLAAQAAGGAAVAGGIAALGGDDKSNTQPQVGKSVQPQVGKSAQPQATGASLQSAAGNAAAPGLTAAETAEIHKLALELSKFKDSNEQINRAYLDYLKKFPTQ